MKIFISIFVLITVSLNAQDINQNLLLHYPFNGNANDTSENGFDGIVQGATLTTDRHNNPNSAYYFDGVNDFIEFPNSYILKPQLPVSFSFWIKYDDVEAENCVVFNTSFEENRSVGVHFNIQNSTKRYSVGYGDGSYNYGSETRRSYISGFEMDTTEWHFITIVITGPQHMKISVDCEFNNGGSYIGEGYELNYSDYPGCIGRHDQDLHLPAYYFKGKLDEFRYWDRALLTSEIEELCYTSVNDFPDLSNNIKVYPNPTNEWIKIKPGFQGEYTLNLIDQYGRLCYSKSNVTKLDMSNLPNGIYIVKVQTSDGKQFFEKIIRQ